MSYQKLLLIDPKKIPSIWFEVKPMIDKVIQHTAGEMNSQDVLTQLLDGSLNLWVGLYDEELFCAGTTEIINYPQKKVLRIIHFATKSGHDYELWKDFITDLERFGTQLGCTSIEAWVRKGLAKKLNWDNNYSVITKNIPTTHGG